MYWSRTLIPTARQAPADAQIASHQWMIRAGLVRQIAAGVYDWLPLGWRAMQKICAIIRQEMDATGAQELHLPALLPAQWWKQTGRYADYGPLLFKVKDRRDTEMILGPTHEECVTELVKAYVGSHKQLPLILYQIQGKFRDEARPRNGLLRVREFFMKDAYSFHSSAESLHETYQAMYHAYVRIFRRCGVPAVAVEAERGPIGGEASHEFICPCAAGEDVMVRSEDGAYAANLERAGRAIFAPLTLATAAAAPPAPLQRVPTPGAATMQQVGQMLGAPPQHMIKTLVFVAGKDAPRPWVLACVRGDHEVNEAKLRHVAGSVELAPAEPARAVGLIIGFVGPHAANTIPAQLVIDPDVLALPAAIAGGNEVDWHVKNFNWRHHLHPAAAQRAVVADIRNAVPGDRSPAGSPLTFSKGIELGHVFKLGTRYSQALGATYLDENQQAQAIIMGCYGIGPGRILVAALETLCDADGINWPMSIAPYQVVITPIQYEGRARQVANQLHAELVTRGVDVLLDDRDQRPGVKFKDADLIGIPLRVVLGEKGLAAGQAELKRRGEKGPVMLPLANLAAAVDERVRKCLAEATL